MSQMLTSYSLVEEGTMPAVVALFVSLLAVSLGYSLGEMIVNESEAG